MSNGSVIKNAPTTAKKGGHNDLIQAEENLFKRLISELQSDKNNDNLKFACLLIFNKLSKLREYNKLNKKSLVEFYKLISIEFVIKLLKYGENELKDRKELEQKNSSGLENGSEKVGKTESVSEASKSQQPSNPSQKSESATTARTKAKAAEAKPEPAPTKPPASNKPSTDTTAIKPSNSDFINLAIQILTNIFNLQLTRETFIFDFQIDSLNRDDKNLLVRKFPTIFMDKLDYYSKNNQPLELIYYLFTNYVDRHYFGYDLASGTGDASRKNLLTPPVLKPRVKNVFKQILKTQALTPKFLKVVFSVIVCFSDQFLVKV